MSVHSRWRDEVRAGHRWGSEWSEQFAEGLLRELDQLEDLWREAAPLADSDAAIMDQILALEVCNWRLLDSIVDLTEAIGSHVPAARPIGHRSSVTPERWAVVWAHYLAIHQYLWAHGMGGDAFASLLDAVDPDGAVREKVGQLVAERDECKELLLQRLLYAMQWVVSDFPWGSTWQEAQNAGIEVIEARLGQLGADPEILKHLAWPVVDGRLQPCSHKFARRIDIVLSSIGAGKWRGQMPLRGTDGEDLARELGEHLAPIAAWLRQDGSASEYQTEEPGASILRNLGQPDPAKRFLARLLYSLLTSQQIAARLRAEGRRA